MSQSWGKLTIREKGRLRKDIEEEVKEETTRLTIQGKAVQLSPFMGTTYFLDSLSSQDEPLILRNKVGITHLFCRAARRTPGRAGKHFLPFIQGFVQVKDSGCHISMEDLKVPVFLMQNQYIAFGYEYWYVGMTLQGICTCNCTRYPWEETWRQQ